MSSAGLSAGKKKDPRGSGAAGLPSEMIIMCRTKERRQLNKTNERRLRTLTIYLSILYRDLSDLSISFLKIYFFRAMHTKSRADF